MREALRGAIEGSPNDRWIAFVPDGVMTPKGRPEPTATIAASESLYRSEASENLDHRLKGGFAALMGGLSPWAAYQAWADWAFHLATSPGQQLDLSKQAINSALALSRFHLTQLTGGEADCPFTADVSDRRFRRHEWCQRPFNLYAQVHLALEAQWDSASKAVRGVAPHHLNRVNFLGRWLLNAMAPVNFPHTNPTVVDTTVRELGMNFVAGANLLIDDLAHQAGHRKLRALDRFRVGQNMATTPGKVIFRNALMELIQYEPSTPTVHAEPILIVPAWIMKYYILDLTPEQSLVRYLVDAGFTVFMISWKNPGGEIRDAGMDDYRQSGVMEALKRVGSVVPNQKIHAVGYCLGGTILSIAAAAMDRDNDRRLASISLLAAQTDFVEAGELLLFIDHSQLATLEDLMHIHGYLEARQMANAFHSLRANELIWSQLVNRYLLGQPPQITALDAWLADPTRMPERMHGEYLRDLFLENRLSRSTLLVNGRAVALQDIRTPVFALGAERDHIAPWRSVYKIVLYSATDTTFALSGGGHNSSVISPPDKRGAYYRIGLNPALAPYIDPDQWLEQTPVRDGSWWPEWVNWLQKHGSEQRTSPPIVKGTGDATDLECAAPGSYVLEL
ncbi:MAG: hypothetical protein RLZZ141_456 [Pseudomonadota bacterium]